MTLVIERPVAFVNAFIFFLIDIPTVWAIHRGLLALQGYYMYRLAKLGQKILIARSRIPIVSGELLRGVSRKPSIFVLANISVYFVIFFATIGVDADERDDWNPGMFNNVTTLVMPRDIAGAHNRSLRLQFQPRQVICETRNETHAQFWPSVFNASSPWGGDNVHRGFRRIHVNNASCQARAPNYKPMLKVQCVPERGKKKCLLDDFPPNKKIMLRRYAQSEPDIQAKRYNLLENANFPSSFHHWVIEHRFKSASPLLPEKIANSPGRSFSFYTGIRDRAKQNNSAIVFFRNTTTNHSYFAFAHHFHDSDSFIISSPFKIAHNSSSAYESVFHSFRTNLDVAMYMTSKTFVRRNVRDVYEVTPCINFENLLFRLLRSAPLLTSNIGYVLNAEKKDVTIIDTRATVLYSIVIGVSILLLPMKELLIILLVRRRKVPEASIFLNDLNVLSKMCRKNADCTISAMPTGNYAEWWIPEQNINMAHDVNAFPVDENSVNWR